jgi:DNA-binding CsgD family transcriptional regulator
MLVGRHAECARLESLIDATRSGSGGALVLRGVPGAGKSALLDFAAERAEGFTVLRGGGTPGEAEVAFAGLLDVLRPVVDRVAELPRPQRAALGGALGLVPPAVERDRFLVGAAVLSLLMRASAERPVLACVDDAHWLDTPSLDALLFASRRLAGSPVGVILAARDEPHQALDAPRLEELAVRALEREPTGVLASSLIGRVPDAGVEAIFRRTQGLPLAITEWSRLGDTEEAVATPVPISRLVERAYARSAEAASEQVRALLLVAAADDSGVLSTVLAAAERLGIPATAVEGAEELGLLEVADGRIRFRHPLVRSAIYQSAAAPLRRRAHRALGACLSGEWQADRRAWHRAAGVVGADEEVAADLAAMAERTRARSGYAVAARALARAAQLTPAPERRAARAIAAADAFWRAGRGSRAEQLLTGVLAETRDPTLRADAEHLLGRLTHFGGDPLAARDILVAGALRVEHEDRERAADLMASALYASYFCGRPALLRETAATAARLAASSAGVDVDARLSAMTGAALTIGKRLLAAEPYLRRSIELATPAEPDALVYAAESHGWLCEYHAARDVAVHALDAAQELGAPGAVAFASALVAEFQATLGELDAAGAEWTETIRRGAETEQGHVMAWSRLQLGYIAANRKGDEEARRLVDSARESNEPLWYSGAGGAAWVLGTSALARGDGETAVAVLADTDLDVSQAAYSPWPVGADLVEAYVRAGRPALAAAALDELAAHAHQTWARAALGRAQGMAAGEDAFDAPLERSATAFARLGVPLEEARSRLCHGERLRRAGRRVQARAQLRGALALFERMRCDPWVERTERELRASGETLRARGPGRPVDQLTPQELQVATLAAAGLSNKEAAARLFLSVKTIEAHLHRTYRKLGVRSRTELAPLLAERDVSA